MLSESTTAYLICLECGHTHRCTCGGVYDPVVSAAICCQCDNEESGDLTHKPVFFTSNMTFSHSTSGNQEAL